jgi:fumarylacetoacetate (FAA) hydrolase
MIISKIRNLIPSELEKQFGFFNSSKFFKLIVEPSTSFAPFACTKDELGDFWKDGRLHLGKIYNNN